MSCTVQDKEDLPDLVNPSIEEKSGKGKCTLRYFYPAKESDRVEWDIKNNVMTFKVFRAGSDRVAYIKESKIIPEDLQKQMEILEKNLKHSTKAPHFEVVMKKKAEFTVDVYFLPDSPPL